MKKTYLILMAGLAVAACHDHGHHDHDHDHGHDHDHEAEELVEHSHNSNEIEISEERQEALGIESSPLAYSQFSALISCSAQIDRPVSASAPVIATSEGVLLYNLDITEGTAVSKGQKVASVSSSGLSGGDPVLIARSAYEAAASEFRRDSLLLESNIISTSHYEQSRLAYIQARSEYESLVSDDASVAVRTPASGYVTEVLAGNGTFVQKGQEIARVASDNRFQIRCDVPERYLSLLSEIKDADFTTAAGESFSVSGLSGRLLSYSRTVKDGYVPVVFEVGYHPALASGQMVDVHIKAGAAREVLSVPVSALIEEQGSYSVFVRLDEDCFEKRAVRTGAADAFSVEILDGLQAGEEIVVSGAMQVKLASVASAPSGHNHNH